jgi:hypothetical protein
MSTTRRNSSTRKYIKIQPVENKFVYHYIRILKTLYEGKKTMNQIFNTLKKDDHKIPYQNDRSKTFDAIRYLEKHNLIKEYCDNLLLNKGKKKKRVRAHHKGRKHVMELTPVGKELSQLIYYLDEFELSYRELKRKINNHFPDDMMNLQPIVLKRRLQQKGWQSPEMKEYDTFIEGVLDMETRVQFVLFNNILSRYLKILYSYGSLNDLAREIIRRVIMDSMTKYMLDRLEGILADKINIEKPVKHNAFRTTYRLLSGSMEAFIGRYVDSYSKNRFIQNESFEVLKNLYYIQEPEESYLQSLLKGKAKTDPEVGTFIQALGSRTTPLRDNGFKS